MDLINYTECRTKNSYKKNKSKHYKINTYIRDVLEYIRQNPQATKTQITKQLRTKIRFLNKHAYEELEEILPDIKRNKNILIQNAKKVDWCRRDIELEEKIKYIVRKVNINRIRKRITIAYLERELNYSNLSIDIDKLPKTKKIIEERCETVEEYQRRRIDIVIEKMISKNEKLSPWKILAKAGIKTKKYYIENKEYIQNKYSM